MSPVHHIMKIPLVIRDIESRTENPEEKAIIAKVLEMKESSLRESDFYSQMPAIAASPPRLIQSDRKLESQRERET